MRLRGESEKRAVAVEKHERERKENAGIRGAKSGRRCA